MSQSRPPGAGGTTAPAPAGSAAADAAVDADALVTAALSCPHVSRMSGGRIGEVATYLPGRQVAGVRITDDEVSVHVVARYGPTAAEVAAQVRTAVAPLAPGRSITVGIDDLDLDPDPADDAQGAPDPPGAPDPRGAMDPLGATGPGEVTAPPTPRVR